MKLFIYVNLLDIKVQFSAWHGPQMDSKLVSVSDDRSAHIWEVASERDDSVGCHPVGLVLFGHNARVWDCCIVDSLIVTAGEDCTCRVWGLDGEQLEMIKEHLGRGIWRCLYDPNSTLLITAGFDSAIKVHQRHASMSMALAKVQESIGTRQTFSICIPNMLEHVGLMNSKSEYVRCLHFTCEDSLYVATNHGYLYQAKLSDTGDARWTELMRVSDEAPIVCMDLLCKSSFEFDNQVVDWVAVGDGKGNMTIVGVISDDTPKVSVSFTWQAEMERQLLGTYWCKSLGYRYIFTADPRGKLKLWRLYDPLQSNSDSSIRRYNVSFVAEFVSSYGMRVMCLDASLEEEVLVCGDLRGNLILFPLLKDMLLGISIASEVKKSPLNYFKGAHGISSVSSVSLATLSSNQIEICSTGADGCICYLEYDRDLNRLEFIGMKQVKELSLIQSVSVDSNSVDTLSGSYATGFASVDFIVWNLIDETKVVQIPCGGWRRPHSYYLGGVPEMNNCFAYVKDELIYVHRYRVHNRDWKIYPQSLHVQFHGREIHSLCFITEDLPLGASSQNIFSKSSWIATGCEDGTVRLTWYSPGTQNWSMSKLLGEHVGGSAVRSICCVSKLHIISSDTAKILDDRNKQDGSTEDKENPTLLISVGAKRVLTSWILRNRRLDKNKNTPFLQQYNVTGDDQYLSGLSASMSFQWLSTDMPAKYSSTKYLENLKGVVGVADDGTKINTRSEAVLSEKGNNNLVRDKYEDDWRYLAVTAFLVKCSGSRITICFVVVACSDATLTLRALVLPLRLWFDVAMLIPLSSPVLALQHVVVPYFFTFQRSDVKANLVLMPMPTRLRGIVGQVQLDLMRISVICLEEIVILQEGVCMGVGVC
ncbi:WD repeat-containing protein [Quillaja saponaria]|uniref:WD repeat-containing protein n=1 Tax=Quillaja saponaria TaxID=32244 RepID=A0AAD7QA81_QUISA|nr:WD repeat-containing protein [Quillaja saponaria]